MSAIPNLNPPLENSAAKPIVATNRTTKLSEEYFNSKIDDGVIRALEGTPKVKRGSRTRPSIVKYPMEIGTGEVPHVMQFKVFWRWEQKDLKESVQAAREENSKKVGELNTLAEMIDRGTLTQVGGTWIEQGELSEEKIAALKNLGSDPNILKVVDPSTNESLATLLQTNPGRAKQLLEQTITTYQTRLSSIESELSDGVGAVGLDDQERLLVLNRLNETIDTTSTGQAAISGAAGGGILGGLFGLLLGGGKGAAVGGVAGAVGGAVAAGGGVALAKAAQNQAVYDQMVSIYLPFCTKINNEDIFQYEDSSQSIAGGAFDFLGRPVETVGQAVNVGLEKAAGAVGAAGAAALARGKVVNPRLEKLFKQKDFRVFNFSWEFYPKTKKEADEIRDIVETFRYHSHPAIDDPSAENEQKVQVILRVPAEFEIRFLSTDPNPNQSGFVENDYLPKIARCALTTVTVDYTPNSVWSSFNDNSPTAVTLSLQFSEMGILTREAVDMGF
jgi:hypothetical protein